MKELYKINKSQKGKKSNQKPLFTQIKSMLRILMIKITKI